jgi:hypothetical protein
VVFGSDASVINVSSSESRLLKALKRLGEKDSNGNALTVICDLSSPEAAQPQVKDPVTKVAEGGKLDHVVYISGDGMASLACPRSTRLAWCALSLWPSS